MTIAQNRSVELLESGFGCPNALAKFRFKGMAGREESAQVLVSHAEM